MGGILWDLEGTGPVRSGGRLWCPRGGCGVLARKADRCLVTDINWKRMLAKSRALEASDKSIAVSMLEVVKTICRGRVVGAKLVVVLQCERVSVARERIKRLNS